MEHDDAYAIAMRIARQCAPYMNSALRYELDADDLTQIAIIGILEQGTLARPQQYVWARGKIYNALRAAHRSTRYRSLSWADYPQLSWCRGWSPLTPEQAVIRKEEYEIARAVVEQWYPGLWEAFLAIFRHSSEIGDSLEEVSIRLHISSRTLRTRLRKTEARLRKVGMWTHP
jgi:RNA polymerase sigma factor (sigma-70 family)